MPTNSTELDNINSEVDALLYQDDNSLCNVTLKVIDKCITSLKKNKSDGNKGFNSNHVIQNYIEGHSNVYCSLLHASKAFDKVYYGKLFTILLARNVSLLAIRLLIDSYVRQQACVSWNGFKYNYFILQNGVKQGGMLSPILFTMYILLLDNLLIKLEHSG